MKDLTTTESVAVTATARRAPSPSATPAVVPTQLPFAEWVCLTLIAQKVSHGWALGTMLAPDGELGRIWTLSRPLTYRAIDGLVDKGLVTRTGQAAGRGRDRVILAADPGRPARRQAVARQPRRAPARRAHRAARQAVPARPGRPRQRGAARRPAGSCSSRPSTPSPRPIADDDLVDLWRRESARAVRRFLDQASHPPEPADGASRSCG